MRQCLVLLRLRTLVVVLAAAAAFWFVAGRQAGAVITAAPVDDGGGDDPIAQQREQWTDGANALALAPGVIAMYDRNRGTLDELSRRGFRIVEAEHLLLGRVEVDLDASERVCISFASHELSRARGGPHCLTHPLLRDP